MTPQDIALWSDLAATPILMIAIASGARGWWYYGHLYREMRDDRNFWRTQALSGTKAAESLAALATATRPA